MTSQDHVSSKTFNLNICQNTRCFWEKSYQQDQWNVLNILVYNLHIFDNFLQGGIVPLKGQYHLYESALIYLNCMAKCSAGCSEHEYIIFFSKYILFCQKFAFQFWAKFWFRDVIEGKLHEGTSFFPSNFRMKHSFAAFIAFIIQSSIKR